MENFKEILNKIKKLCFGDKTRRAFTGMIAIIVALCIVAVVLIADLSSSNTTSTLVSSDVTSEVTSSEEVSSEETSSEEVSSEEVSSKETSSATTSSEPPKPQGAEIMSVNGISVAKIDKSKLSYYKNSVNSNTVGWIAIPNTNINYAVVQKYQDNDYYINRNYYKKYVDGGASIWADGWCSFGSSRSSLSNNTVIYGHNWTNCWRPTRIGYSSDKWFAQLAAYDHLSFAQQNPYISFSTNSQEMYWQIFAVIYTDIGWDYINEKTDPAILAAEAKRRSIFNYDVDVTSSDKILTLSTCTRVYGSSKNQRFVVMAKLIDSTTNFPAVTITKNPNPKQPNL